MWCIRALSDLAQKPVAKMLVLRDNQRKDARMAWRQHPIIIQIEGSPVALKFSSLRAYQYSLGLVALCLLCAGWLLGSGLLALKETFRPYTEHSEITPSRLPTWEQGSLKTGTTSRSYAGRWTTTSNAYAGTNPTDINTNKKKGTGHE